MTFVRGHCHKIILRLRKASSAGFCRPNSLPVVQQQCQSIKRMQHTKHHTESLTFQQQFCCHILVLLILRLFVNYDTTLTTLHFENQFSIMCNCDATVNWKQKTKKLIN